MPGFTGTGPAIVTALVLVGLIGGIAVFTRDPARRAAALEVLRMLLRIRPGGAPGRAGEKDQVKADRLARRSPPARGNRGQARHRRDRQRNRAASARKL